MRAWVVATYNPAVLTKRRDPNQAATIDGHIDLVRRILDGTVADRATIITEPARAPRVDDPRIGSVDIETYGACNRNARGLRLPRQTVFHPTRMVTQDGILSPILTVAITPCTGNLNTFSPLPTPVFHFHIPQHRLWLIQWFNHLHTILGQNLPYDLACLRHFLTSRRLSARTHRLYELSVFNYLQCEIRLERSLKDISNVLGTHQYDEEMGKFDDPSNRFPNPFKPNRSGRTLSFYNAEDTTTVPLNIAALCTRIQDQYPNTEKLTDYALTHYSNIVWRCNELSEAGLSYSRRRLFALEDQFRRRIQRAERTARIRYNLLLSGKGSEKSRLDYLYRCVTAIDRARPAAAKSVLSDNRVKYTTRKKELSTSDVNRYFFLTIYHDCIEDDPSCFTTEEHLLFRGLRLFAKHGRASKILGTFIYPLLYHQRGNSKNRKSLALPPPSLSWARPLSPEQIAKRQTEEHKAADLKGKREKDSPEVLAEYRAQPRKGPRVLITYPTYFPVPSADESDPDLPGGGTQQGRITAKNHSIATDPPEIQTAYESRFPGGTFVSWDLSQVELRVPGILTGEPSIVEAYANNRDLHWERAEHVYGIEALASEFGKDYREAHGCKSLRRRPAKHFNFGDLFLAQAKTLQLTILRLSQKIVPISICQQTVAQRPELRPVLWEWQQKMIRLATTQHYIELPITGQSRLFIGSPEVVEETYASTIVNFPIQTTAANILHDIHNRLAAWLPDPLSQNPWCLICYNKYDALGFDLRYRSDLPQLRGFVAKALEETCRIGYVARLYDHYGHIVPIMGEWSTAEAQ